MHAPAYSTFALIAELFVSTAIFYTFYQGYKHGRFPEKIAFGAVGYEILFNISYMVYRLPEHESHFNETARQVLGAVHGTLSLAMFLSLVAFFVLAAQNYGYYPSLHDMNLPEWRGAHMKSLDEGALADPSSSCDPAKTACLTATPKAGAYSYAVTDSSGKSCEADDTTCAKYTLTATLETGGTLTKTNLD